MSLHGRIIRRGDAYNTYSRVTDDCEWARAITLNELREYVKEEHGNCGLRDLEKRLEKMGDKQFEPALGRPDLSTLEDVVRYNHAGNGRGQRGKRLSPQDFIDLYLTLPTEEGA